MWQTDPADQFTSGYIGMGNMPTMATDPDGRFAWFIPLIASFVSSYVQSGISTKNWGWGSIGQGLASAGLTALGAGVAHQITGLAGSLGASKALSTFAGQTVSSLAISGVSGGNALQGLASTYIGGAMGRIKNPTLQYASNAVLSGVVGGIVNENSGGGFWDGFGRGAVNSIISTAISRTAMTIGDYIEESRNDQAQLEYELGLDKEGNTAYYKEKPGGDLAYQVMRNDESYDDYKARYDKYDGLIGMLRGLDPQEHFKVGQLHFRKLAVHGALQFGALKMGKAFKNLVGIPHGFSVHYDKYDVVLAPIRHLFVDTFYQGKRWGRQ
jgi:hypothetical protein